MKSKFAVSLFFLLVFVHGMNETDKIKDDGIEIPTVVIAETKSKEPQLSISCYMESLEKKSRCSETYYKSNAIRLVDLYTNGEFKHYKNNAKKDKAEKAHITDCKVEKESIIYKTSNRDWKFRFPSDTSDVDMKYWIDKCNQAILESTKKAIWSGLITTEEKGLCSCLNKWSSRFFELYENGDFEYYDKNNVKKGKATNVRIKVQGEWNDDGSNIFQTSDRDWNVKIQNTDAKEAWKGVFSVKKKDNDPQYILSVTVSGLAQGDSVEFTSNSIIKTATANGQIDFTPMITGTQYNVQILTQPKTQTCTVAMGEGSLTEVVTVPITCVDLPPQKFHLDYEALTSWIADLDKEDKDVMVRVLALRTLNKVFEARENKGLTTKPLQSLIEKFEYKKYDMSEPFIQAVSKYGTFTRDAKNDLITKFQIEDDKADELYDSLYSSLKKIEGVKLEPNTIEKEKVIPEEKEIEKARNETEEVYDVHAHVVTLTNITWKKSAVDQKTNENYIWRVIDSTKVLESTSAKSIDDFEEKINQLYKYTRYDEIPKEEHWCLELKGFVGESPMETTILPVLIPISKKVIETEPTDTKPTDTIPGLKDLRTVLNFGKFGDLSTSGFNRWEDLNEPAKFAIKLYLFSQNPKLTPYFSNYDNKNNDNLLLRLQKSLLGITTAEINKCPSGHPCDKMKNYFNSYTCEICEKNDTYWEKTKCNLCNDVNQSMCTTCYKKNKFGDNTKEKLTEHLRENAAKSDFKTNFILKEFLVYISQLNWKISIQKEKSHNLLTNFPELPKNQDTTKMEEFKRAQLLYAKLSDNYHQFCMDIESQPENAKKWQFQLDEKELAKTIIDLTKIEWTWDSRIPPLQPYKTIISVGYTNTNHSQTETTQFTNYQWSVKAGVNHIIGPKQCKTQMSAAFSYTKSSEDRQSDIQTRILTNTHATTIEKSYSESDVHRDVYVLTYYGKYRSTKQPIEWKDEKFITIIERRNDQESENEPNDNRI